MRHERYTRQNIVANAYYQLPKFLFDDKFSDLSDTAKILYALLRNRHEMSVKNSWFDENGKAYLYFKREDIQALMKRSDKTVTKAIAELREHHLLEELKQGSMKPNRIYLLHPNTAAPGIEAGSENDPDAGALANHDTEKLRVMPRNNYEPIPGESTTHDPEMLRRNHNEINHNELNTKRERARTPACGVYGEYRRVRLTADEYSNLIAKYGEAKTHDYINRLDRHIASGGKAPKGSHSAKMEQWIAADDRKQAFSAQSEKPNKNRFCNFAGRGRDYAALERMEQRYLIDSLKANGGDGS